MTRWPSLRDVGVVDVGFAALCLALVLLTPIAQLVWMIVFDSSGLDVHAPDAVFMHLLPAASVAVVPAGAGRRRYGRNAFLACFGVVLVASLAVSTYTVGFFALCGPGC